MAPGPRPLIERFLAKVRAPLADDGTPDPFYCWIWVGARKFRRSGPVGQMKVDGRVIPAPRVALAIKTGELKSSEIHACHTTDCTTGGLCVNWWHLYWGTVEENIRDHERDYGQWGMNRKYGRAGETPERWTAPDALGEM